MPLPATIPLAELLASGLGSLGVGAGIQQVLKNIPEGDTTQLEDTFKRLFLGPSVLPKTIDTPSGKVFAPDDKTPAKPDILATYPQSKDQPWIMSSPMPAGEPQGITGLPMPEIQDKLKGFEKPQDVDMTKLSKDLSVEDIQKQIQVKKSKISNTYDFIYNGKIVGQIEKLDKKFKGLNDYNLIDTSISEGGPFDAQVGFNEAKYSMLSGIANRIKNKQIDLDDYKLIEDYYGDIIKTTKEITGNPTGSLIDKPLSDETN